MHVNDMMDEFIALDLLVREAKVGTDHEQHDGWSLAGDPHVARCVCGAPMEEWAA